MTKGLRDYIKLNSSLSTVTVSTSSGFSSPVYPETDEDIERFVNGVAHGRGNTFEKALDYCINSEKETVELMKFYNGAKEREAFLKRLIAKKSSIRKAKIDKIIK